MAEGLIRRNGAASPKFSPKFPQARGGTVTDITDGGVDYRVHTFTSNGFFVVTGVGGIESVEYLVVAGGGAGSLGGSSNFAGGGGGAGGYLCSVAGELSGGNTQALDKLSLTVGTYLIVVGGGGDRGEFDGGKVLQFSGQNSRISSASGVLVEAIGGGRGASESTAADVGGSGGGGANQTNASGAAGTTGQGFSGGNGDASDTSNRQGGGGGGAGQPGANAASNNPGDGGDGIESNITGTPTYRAGGGGGGRRGTDDFIGLGGLGGGGNGGATTTNTGIPGTLPQDGKPNTGGGGGGAGRRQDGTNGGSGIVVIRYPI